jgi:cysteinyl-tRNA synthetase
MKIYDTLTREKHEFTPFGKTVRLYVCGVTPYAPAHIGHAMSYITFDVVRRYLDYQGFKVEHVQNFTDIDDKLIDRASIEQTDVSILAESHIEAYFRDMDSLNIVRAHKYPRATQEIPKMIEVISNLVEKDFAYDSGGDVYFRVERAAGYGKLSHRRLDGMRAGARVDLDERKDHPMDFVLWKSAKKGEPFWDSPWGPGRPGWHIECTAMALQYLGETVDIHGGGHDLIFPHHENEIAQSEAYTGQRPFARFWMHNGLLQINQQKMSKSLSNMVTISESIEAYSADALRLTMLGSHYRVPNMHSEELIAAAERSVARLTNAAMLGGSAHDTDSRLDPNPYRDEFLAAMDDDFNTPNALAVLFGLARDINRASDQGRSVLQAQRMLLELGREILGLKLEIETGNVSEEFQARVDSLIEIRAALRKTRDFTGADKVRNDLADLGVSLTDSSKGTLWHLTDRE